MKKLAAAIAVLAISGCTQQSDLSSIPDSIELNTTETTQSEESADSETLNPPTQPSDSENETTDSDSSDASAGIGAEGDQSMVIDDSEIEIEDQSGDGTSVQIAEIQTSLAAGLLVIFRESGEILGYSKVSPTAQPVTLDLSTRLSFDSELVARLYADNGNGVFDSADLPVYERDDDDLERVEEDFEYEVR